MLQLDFQNIQRRMVRVSEKTAMLAKRTLSLIVMEPKHLTKPEVQLQLYLLSKQRHMIEADPLMHSAWATMKLYTKEKH